MAVARPEPFFIAGSAGLDFLNSIATPADVPIDWLSSGDDLLDWLRHTQFLDADVASALRKSALPGEIDVVATQARSLREWFRGFVHAHRGRPLEADALDELEPLNQLLSRDQEYARIVNNPEPLGAASPLCRIRTRNWSSPEALLLPIADALASVVCDENFANIKSCEGQGCTLLYVDRTRALGRRWCSMLVCGNRSKQRARRERKRTS